MPPFLSEPPVILVALLGVMGLLVAGAGLVVTFSMAEQKGARSLGRGLLALGVLLLLLMLGWLLAGFFIESPREEAVRRVNDMANAVTEKDWAKFNENVSESFQKGHVNKGNLKGYFEQVVQYRPRAVAWDFARTDPPHMTDTEVVIQFDAKGELPTGEPILRHFEATFVKDPDGKFRMRTYREFDYVQKTREVGGP